MDYRLRVATAADQPLLHDLIARSIRELGAGDYTSEQIEAALLGAFGVDTQLIRDRTYFVIDTDDDQIVGCGGWSRRQTLFGSDSREVRNDAWLDPATDAARIRAFFIDARHARRGLGRMLLDRCEAEAMRAGFSQFALMATLPGKRLYEVCGYVGTEPIEHPLPGGLQITFVPMTKRR